MLLLHFASILPRAARMHELTQDLEVCRAGPCLVAPSVALGDCAPEEWPDDEVSFLQSRLENTYERSDARSYRADWINSLISKARSSRVELADDVPKAAVHDVLTLRKREPSRVSRVTGDRAVGSLLEAYHRVHSSETAALKRHAAVSTTLIVMLLLVIAPLGAAVFFLVYMTNEPSKGPPSSRQQSSGPYTPYARRGAAVGRPRTSSPGITAYDRAAAPQAVARPATIARGRSWFGASRPVFNDPPSGPLRPGSGAGAGLLGSQSAQGSAGAFGQGSAAAFGQGSADALGSRVATVGQGASPAGAALGGTGGQQIGSPTLGQSSAVPGAGRQGAGAGGTAAGSWWPFDFGFGEATGAGPTGAAAGGASGALAISNPGSGGTLGSTYGSPAGSALRPGSNDGFSAGAIDGGYGVHGNPDQRSVPAVMDPTDVAASRAAGCLEPMLIIREPQGMHLRIYGAIEPFRQENVLDIVKDDGEAVLRLLMSENDRDSEILLQSVQRVPMAYMDTSKAVRAEGVPQRLVGERECVICDTPPEDHNMQPEDIFATVRPWGQSVNVFSLYWGDHVHDPPWYQVRLTGGQRANIVDARGSLLATVDMTHDATGFVTYMMFIAGGIDAAMMIMAFVAARKLSNYGKSA